MTPKILQKQSEREKKAPRTPNDHRAAGKKTSVRYRITTNDERRRQITGRLKALRQRH